MRHALAHNEGGEEWVGQMKITLLPDTYFIENLSVSSLQDRMYCIVDLEGTGINPVVESVTQSGYEYDLPILKRHCDEYLT
ncbi:hypothetical protein [Paenibacillus sp. SAF-068]|uniref:hypothetical protein n=1 Tax=Paenibacillus sp. SAF-068 TaxID=3436864 RepID=UPI003F80A10E